MMPIAITRIAVRSALGCSLEETVEALRKGTVGVRTPSALEQTPKIDVGAGEVPLAADPADPRGEWRAETLLRGALDDVLSERERGSIAAAPQRWGMVIGTTLAGMRHCGVGIREEIAGRQSDADLSFARTCAASVLAHASRSCGITGPTMIISRACASALTAMSDACCLLAVGEVDAVIAGGYDPIAEFAYGGFSALQLVAAGPLSPFAEEREGMKLGEGAALFVLRRLADLSSAERDQLRAVIVAAAETSDAHHLTQPHPHGGGAARALADVLVGRGKPDLIVAHATGTPSNDSAEYEAYRSALGGDIRAVPVVALKSRFGHPLGAAGALELASALGCAERGFTPSSAGRGPDAVAFPDLDLITGATRNLVPDDIVALSAGFGGANAALRVVRGVRAGSDVRSAPANSVRLAVIAAGAVSPAGRGVAALAERASEPGAWPEFSEETLAPLLDRAKTRRLALLPRLMIAAVRDLAERAGLEAKDLRETPLLAANWCGAADFTERYYRDLVQSGIDLANPMLFAESVPNIGSAHCSISFGIEATASSVIGRRTSGIEALMLAMARIGCGAWPRAIIVAAEEAHPLVQRVLTRCAGADVQLRSCAIAVLVESESVARDLGHPALMLIDRVIGRSSPLAPKVAAALVCDEIASSKEADRGMLTTDSPFDNALRASAPRCDIASVAEMGAASPFAAMWAARRGRTIVPTWVGCSDPHGACWAMLARGIPSPDGV